MNPSQLLQNFGKHSSHRQGYMFGFYSTLTVLNKSCSSFSFIHYCLVHESDNTTILFLVTKQILGLLEFTYSSQFSVFVDVEFI